MSAESEDDITSRYKCKEILDQCTGDLYKDGNCSFDWNGENLETVLMSNTGNRLNQV